MILGFIHKMGGHRLLMLPQPAIDSLLGNATSYSIEFYPPKTEKGEALLRERMPKFLGLNRPMEHRPLFVDITWGAGGSTAQKTMSWVREWVENYPGVPVNMHLTCTNMSIEVIQKVLEDLGTVGVRNLVALRGDPPVPSTSACEGQNSTKHFTYGADLVKYIRESEVGSDYKLHITVGGYPEGHPDTILPVDDETPLSNSERRRVGKNNEAFLQVCRDGVYENELEHLAKKVGAGANLVISQLFFDVNVFHQFVIDARAKGVNCPILPGIMLIQDYQGFKRMIGFCKTRIPNWILEDLEVVKGDPEAVRAFGVKVARGMIRDLQNQGVTHFHFYCLNRLEVLDQVLDEVFK